MLDKSDDVRRYIAEYSATTDELLSEHDLEAFDLNKFQSEFCESDDNPMFDCYPITASNVEFTEKYMRQTIDWNFVNKAYFLETRAAKSSFGYS